MNENTVIEQLERRLARLEDIDAIKQLKSRYLNACDRQDPQMVVASDRGYLPDRAGVPVEVLIALQGPPEVAQDVSQLPARHHHVRPGVRDAADRVGGVACFSSSRDRGVNQRLGALSSAPVSILHQPAKV